MRNDGVVVSGLGARLLAGTLLAVSVLFALVGFVGWGMSGSPSLQVFEAMVPLDPLLPSGRFPN